MLLHYITDRKGFAGSSRQQLDTLVRRIGEAARAGVDYIQLREKDLTPRELEALAGKALSGIRASSASTRLLINSRSDIALAIGADGVHLPATDVKVQEIRTLWARCSNHEPLIGVSAHTANEVRDAQTDGADFAILAPIFEKVHSATPGIGLEPLRQAWAQARAQQETIPPPRQRLALLALGGVSVSNARECVQAGADGVAGIRLFQQGDVFDTVRQLREVGA